MATVAIVVPVYATEENMRLNYMCQTLESVANQTFKDIVCIVVDDDSKVDVEGFVSGFNNPKFRYVRREKKDGELKTASNALNMGFGLAMDKSSDVFSSREAQDLAAICYLHSDDLLPRSSVAKRLKQLDAKAPFVFSNIITINAEGNVLGEIAWAFPNVKKSNLRRFPHHSSMWSIDFAKSIRDYVACHYSSEGIFDPQLSHYEDRDASISAVETANDIGASIKHIASPLYVYRLHESSISRDPEREVRILVQRPYVEGKHNLQAYHAPIIQHMMLDLPWSVFYALPEGVKSRIRPIKDAVKGFFGSSHTQEKNLPTLQEILTQP